MNIIVYQSASPRERHRLGDVVRRMFPENRIESYVSIPGLASRLRRARNDVALAILSAVSKKEFQEITGLGDLLRGLRIVLILPDRDHDTIANAHALYPRYLSFLDSGVKELVAVLEKMMKQAPFG